MYLPSPSRYWKKYSDDILFMSWSCSGYQVGLHGAASVADTFLDETKIKQAIHLMLLKFLCLISGPFILRNGRSCF